jgi:hypothetical protein
VRWSLFDAHRCAAMQRGDDLAVAEAVREEALRLQQALRAEEMPDA